ncbi:hypothetical protein O6H91_Y298300 [Diphasiastrum complanatum]|nr:hypothetical protein O6H91_Y298300 [Diphasiastrum complanatum]
MGTTNMENLIAAPVGGRFEISPLVRQHSIYSLTLDEFQNTVGESGKQFGSMNMDEFLKNVWTAEENQAMAAAMAGGGNEVACNGLLWQGSLSRQGSLALPRTLSRKTVDEVWKDIIYQGSGCIPINDNGSGAAQQHPRELTLREMTLEDFLLKAGVVREEMLVEKQPTTPYGGGLRGDYGLGVGNTRTGERVEEKLNNQSALGALYANQEGGNAQEKGERDKIGVGATFTLSTANPLSSKTCNNSLQLDHCKPAVIPDWLNSQYGMTSVEAMPPQPHARPQHQQQQQQQQQHQRQQLLQQQQQLLLHQQVAPETGAILEVTQRGCNWTPPEGTTMRDCYGAAEATSTGGLVSGFVGRVAAKSFGTDLGTSFGGRTDASGLALGSVSPCSPLSDEQSHGNGFGMTPIGNCGLDGTLRGRKRGAELTIDKVIERRQRRMIKNRESAARSRARKQAFTVELEAELAQLKEENHKLRKQQDVVRRKRQLVLELIMDSRARHFSPPTNVLRRTATGPW